MSVGSTVFLLSPARLNGQRGKMLMNATADSELARALRSPEGASLATTFTFVSGLYFRGKVAYARAFGQVANGLSPAHVLTAGGGLCPLEERVTLARLERWANVSISEKNPHFTAPLLRHASELLELHGEEARFVLLGSVATNKYVEPLLEIFGEKLLFPKDFTGRGDMSRGSLMLRAAREKRELDYAPLASRNASEESAPEE